MLWVKPEGWDGWTAPGGSVESGETLRETAQRETIEESGLSVSAGRTLVVVTQTYVPESNPGREDSGGFVLFDAPADGTPELPEPGRLGDPEETLEDIGWFDQHPPLDDLDPVALDCLTALDTLPGETELDENLSC